MHRITFISDDKIATIKALRAASGMDLKTSKDAFEQGLLVNDDQGMQTLRLISAMQADVAASNVEYGRKANFAISIAAFDPPHAAPVALPYFS